MVKKKNKNKRLHIIITGDTGEGRTFSIRQNTIRNGLISIAVIAAVLSLGTLRSTYHLQENWLLKRKTTRLTAELQINHKKMSRELENTKGELNQKLQDTRHQLNQKLVTTKDQLNQQLAAARNELAAIIQEKERLSNRYEQQLANLRQDRENLLEGSISKLDERSKAIENVIDELGVKIKIANEPAHSGGPYISLDESYGDKLISNTDKYISALKKMPLGLPVKTKITSRFGMRQDPFNQKNAFHAGIDFRGNSKTKVKSTGQAVVKEIGYNRGFGKYVILSHGNGYETMYAHLSKQLVKKDDQIKRGQDIGFIGNTGRSTGTHLHYEVRHHGKAINPIKYLKVADLNVSTSK